MSLWAREYTVSGQTQKAPAHRFTAAGIRASVD